MLEGPLVSIIIPTHNRIQALKRAVESALSQDYKNIELVVVDDGSEDETWAYLTLQKDLCQLVIAKHDEPQGACAARNKAIQLANGEFIANLDDDDFFEPNRISELVAAFRDGVAAVTSYDKFISNHGRIRIWKKKRIITFNDLLYRNRAGSTFLTKKSFLLEIDGFDESLIAAQDHDIFLRLTKYQGHIRTVTKILHNVDDEESSPRITTSSSAWLGYYDFYCKHKAEMNAAQRGSNLYLILKAKGKGSFKNILKLAPCRFWPVELRSWLRKMP